MASTRSIVTWIETEVQEAEAAFGEPLTAIGEGSTR